LIKKLVAATAALCATAVVTGAFAGDLERHPNIVAADRATLDAIARMRDAQHANGYDMHGHAARAIDLLQQARAEMRAAAIDATH
jgi:hypothetical protein